MLKPVRMKKVKVIAPLKYKCETGLSLHKFGAMHINDISKRINDAEWKHILSCRIDPDSDDQFRDYYGRLCEVDKIFSHRSRKDGKRSFFKKTRSGIKDDESFESEISKRVDELLLMVESRVLEIRDDIARFKVSIDELNERRNVLVLLGDVESRLDLFSGPSYVGMLFKADKERFYEIKPKLEAIGKIVIEMTDVKGESYVLLTYPKDLEDAVSGCLNEIEILKIEVPCIPNKPIDEIHKIERKIKTTKCEKVCAEKELYATGEKWGQEVSSLKEDVDIIVDRHTLYSKCASTESSFVLEFFVPEKREDEVVSLLMMATDGRVIIYSVEPMDEDRAEKVPVLLSNPSLVKPFEGLTKMYSVPKYNDFDPTIFIAPAMMLFFGIMLNDAGYGMLLALIGFLLYRHYKDVNMEGKDAGIMLVLLGFSAGVFGVISGGYFGDALRRVYPGLGYLIDPLGDSNITVFGASVENPILFVLVFSLIVGLLYVNIGYVLGIADCVNKIRSVKGRGNRGSVKSLYDQIIGHVGMLVFECGLFGLIFWWKLGWFHDVVYFSYVSLSVLVIGLVMLARGGGVQTLFGFFDVTGFVGDDLSFIRLLALCLATEGIANVVNMFAGFSLSIPYVGVVLGSLIFIFGHVFNLMVGALGAGIHALRLQYVEFFSKFYEGGGVEFEAYSVKRKKGVAE